MVLGYLEYAEYEKYKAINKLFTDCKKYGISSVDALSDSVKEEKFLRLARINKLGSEDDNAEVLYKSFEYFVENAMFFTFYTTIGSVVVVNVMTTTFTIIFCNDVTYH